MNRYGTYVQWICINYTCMLLSANICMKCYVINNIKCCVINIFPFLFLCFVINYMFILHELCIFVYVVIEYFYCFFTLLNFFVKICVKNVEFIGLVILQQVCKTQVLNVTWIVYHFVMNLCDINDIIFIK